MSGISPPRRGLRQTGWLLVCEATPRWSPWLHRLVDGHDFEGWRLRVTTRRQPPPMSEILSAPPPTVLMIEAAADNFAAVLTHLHATRGAPAVATLALAGRGDGTSIGDDPSATGALLEAGAARVVRSPAELPAVLPVVLRCLERSAATLDRTTSLRESLWRRLPWQPEPWPLR